MPQVPMQKTPQSITTLAPALQVALVAKLHELPSRNLAEMLLATILFETANGQAIYNYNVGNVTTNRAEADYWMTSGNANHFAVYQDIESGIAGYLFEILRRPTLVAAAKAGDPYAYAVQYRDTKYCPDCDPSRTSKTFAALRDKVRGLGLYSNLSGPNPTTLPDPKAPSPSSLSSGLSGQSSTARPVYVPAPLLPVLRRGHRGSAVELWQRLVNAEPDSSFGPLTEAATRTFQAKHQLAATGVVDAETWLKAVRGSQLPVTSSRL